MKRGFSIIDLLLCIVIISIISTLLAPLLIKGKPKPIRSDLFVTQCVDGVLTRPNKNGTIEYVRDAAGNTVSCKSE